MTHPRSRLGPLPTALAVVTFAAFLVAGCGTISTSPPAPTPADFQGIAAEIVSRGIVIDDLVSGDSGCNDHTLTQTAIGFDASGLDQAAVDRVRIYIFRDGEAYTRLRSTIDACVEAYMNDPATFETIDDSPFVLVGQGPWAPEFKAALREALQVSAGTGG